MSIEVEAPKEINQAHSSPILFLFAVIVNYQGHEVVTGILMQCMLICHSNEMLGALYNIICSFARRRSYHLPLIGRDVMWRGHPPCYGMGVRGNGLEASIAPLPLLKQLLASTSNKSPSLAKLPEICTSWYVKAHSIMADVKY